MRKQKIIKITGYLMILLIWFLLAAYNREIAGKPFPYPHEAFISLFKQSGEGYNIFIHAGASLLRWGAGFAAASAAGIVIGLFIAFSPKFNLLLTPLITVLQLIPGLAWVPIVLILFGLGNLSTIFMIAVTALVPVIINTRAGVQQIDPLLLKAAGMMELKYYERFFLIIIPGASPSIISGLRTGAANGFRVLISAEMIVGSELGLGYSIFQARWSLDYASAFGALILIIVIGLVLDRFIFAPVELKVMRKRGLADA